MQQWIPCLEINLSHVSGCAGSFALHLLVLLHGALLEPNPQPLSEAVFDHLTVALQHCLGCKKKRKSMIFVIGAGPLLCLVCI